MKRFLLGYCNLDLESFPRSSATLASKVFTTLYKSSSTIFSTSHLAKTGAKEEGERIRGVNITEIEI